MCIWSRSSFSTLLFQCSSYLYFIFFSDDNLAKDFFSSNFPGTVAVLSSIIFYD